ncbi:MAG: exodeoxyribonuclease VII large subunit, partial [Clostridia bacterium]
LSPLKTLLRGYSIVEKNGKVVKKVEDLNTGDEISIRLENGKKKAKII